jgi:hypothetical protein
MKWGKNGKPKRGPVLEYIGKQRHNWRDHDNRMDRIKMPNKFCNARLAAEDLWGVRQNV